MVVERKNPDNFEVKYLDPATIVACRFQTRMFVGPDAENPDLAELAEQLKSAGGNHTPVTVRPLGDEGRYELACGERRVRACRLAGLPVLAIVRELSDEAMWEICVSENLHSESLRPLEEAAAVAQMLEHGWDHARIADHIGRSVKWVARRSKLRDLSATWRKLVGDPTQGVSRWGASHLELVARFPESVQDEIAERYASNNEYDAGEYAFMTVGDLKRELGDFLHALAGAPWDLADETLVERSGACVGCPKRSDCQRELFDDDELDDGPKAKGKNAGVGNARCLDPECWETKLIAFLEAQRKELERKHGTKPILVGGSYLAPAPYKAEVVSEYQVEKTKKSDPEARPALVVEGPKAGTVMYVKAGGKKAPSAETRAGAAAGPTLDERIERIAGEREKLVCRKVLAAIEAMVEDVKNLDDSDIIIAPDLASIFGTINCHALPMSEAPSRWKEWADLDALEGEPRWREVYEKLFVNVLGVLSERLRVCLQTWKGGLDREARSRALVEIEGLADVLGFDLAAMRLAAAYEKPYPASLVKALEAAGRGTSGEVRAD